MKEVSDGIRIKTVFLIDKFKGALTEEQRKAYLEGKLQPFETVRSEGNLGLNEGIQNLLDLIFGLATPTKWDNANARIGVGDSNVAEQATQTGLQAATNKTWKPMMAGYPQRTAQTVELRAEFGLTDANYAWEEGTIVNAADDTGQNLNRKVTAQGTKPNTETWIARFQLTVS